MHRVSGKQWSFMLLHRYFMVSLDCDQSPEQVWDESLLYLFTHSDPLDWKRWFILARDLACYCISVPCHSHSWWFESLTLLIQALAVNFNLDIIFFQINFKMKKNIQLYVKSRSQEENNFMDRVHSVRFRWQSKNVWVILELRILQFNHIKAFKHFNGGDQSVSIDPKITLSE